MIRIILFLLLVGVAGLGAAWIADQSGDVSLAWGGWQLSASVSVAALGFGLAIVACVLAWDIMRGLWRLPRRLQRARRARRDVQGREAIAQGLIAIGAGDTDAARRYANDARRFARNDPLTLLLGAQSAQLSGDREAARHAFNAMAEREDTRLLGLRGLFIEAQRSDDPVHAVAAAEEALKLSPGASWASHAVLGFRCAQGDWTGALAIVERNHASGSIGRHEYRRQRAVLLTARALEVETSDRDLSRTSVMEAVKLAPTLVPAAALAGRFLSEAQQIRKAMQIIETAWLAQPHPDLADAYAHVRLGDSALERLRRIERLADTTPGHAEGALGIARVAADAREFARARGALAPLLDAPTQRVALLMAEIERGEHDDEGAARAWTLRAVHAALDPAWTADGYVSDRWRPVSPVSGRLDAFQWVVPVAALPSDRGVVIETETHRPRGLSHAPGPVAAPGPSTQQDTDATAVTPEAEPVGDAPVTPPAQPPEVATIPVFRPRRDITRPGATAPVIPVVIPLVRAPDDPGVDDNATTDEFGADTGDKAGQAGGLRGFLSRLTR